MLHSERIFTASEIDVSAEISITAKEMQEYKLMRNIQFH